MAGQKPSKLYETNSIGSSSSSGAKIGRKDLVIVESVNAAKYPDEDDRVRITPMENLVEDYFNQNIEKMYVQQWLGSPVGSFTYNEDGTLKSAIAVYGDGSAGTVDNIIYNLDGMLESAVFTVNGKTVNVTITYAQDLVSSIEYETVGGYTPPVEVPIVLSSTFVPFTAKVGETPDESVTNTGIQKVEVSSPITGSLNISFDSANFEASADKTVWTPTLSGIDLSILANRTFYVRVKTTATLETQTVMTLNGSGVVERTIALVPHIGDGTETYPYPIAIPAQLDAVRDDLTKAYKQYVNISLSAFDGDKTNDTGTGFDPIGNIDSLFTGIYDGDFHEISSLYIRSSKPQAGLFFGCDDATIKNIKIVSGAVASTHSVGNAGMLVGIAHESLISHCAVTGTVAAHDAAGGIVAGIARTYTSSIIEDSSFIGTTAAMTTGGIAGYVDTDATARRCFSGGDIVATGEGSMAGGITGHLAGTLENCYSTARVSSEWAAGGIAGVASDTLATTNNCWASGQITALEIEGETLAGGITGYYEVPWMNYLGAQCFWDTQTSGVATSAGVGFTIDHGKTTAQMKAVLTYEDWDFVNIWDIVEGEGYPFLRGNRP